MKWKLKKFYDIDSDNINCIFSVEKATSNLLPLDDAQTANPSDFGAVDNFRIRIMPVLGTSPANFGIALASFVLCKLTNHYMEPESTEATSKNFKQKMKQLLEANEVSVCLFRYFCIMC